MYLKARLDLHCCLQRKQLPYLLMYLGRYDTCVLQENLNCCLHVSSVVLPTAYFLFCFGSLDEASMLHPFKSSRSQ